MIMGNVFLWPLGFEPAYLVCYDCSLCRVVLLKYFLLCDGVGWISSKKVSGEPGHMQGMDIDGQIPSEVSVVMT